MRTIQILRGQFPPPGPDDGPWVAYVHDRAMRLMHALAGTRKVVRINIHAARISGGEQPYVLELAVEDEA